ncbi:MAG: tyrosine--tRNA ligase [Candidatus Staskawiczbacteria bacterium]|nr:tyrosine--tRNA ligase [Candidatus Staskawiczbacteria bacterium]
MTDTNEQKIDEVLNRGTIVEILPTKDEFRKELLSGKKLRFYIGFDATSPTLHLSHAKNIILMEKFRKLGHEVIILFGDFTARIGDPSGENSARKQLSRKEVVGNVKKWKQLIKPLMNFNDLKNPPKIKYNNDWLSKLTMEEVIDLASNFTVQRLLERDMFQKRIREEKPIHLHEFLYPLMQGYDSVAMGVDVEVCGTDQIFNALAGRDLIKKLKGKDKFVIAVTLMENPKTGELMSKSKGTGVFLDAKPADMYGQIMAQPDEMTEILFVNNTYLPLEEIKEIVSGNPRDAKAHLALEIAKIFFGEKEAKKAEEEFNKVYRDKELPSDMPVFNTNTREYFILDLLCDTRLAPSKNEAKRLVEAGAVDIDDKTEKEWKKSVEIKDGMIIKVGSRKFVKIKLK